MRADGRVYLVLTLTRTGADEQRTRFHLGDDGTWVREPLYSYGRGLNYPEIPESST
jgi:hypothetical protein